MGLKDRMIAKAMANAPDYVSILTAALGPDDAYVAHAFTVPSAFERKASRQGTMMSSHRLETIVTRTVVAAVKNNVAERKHVGGEDGSVATQLPRDPRQMAMTVSASGLSFFDMGLSMREDPTLTLSIPRSSIASFTLTGEKAQGQVPIVRLTFVDGSYFDYRMMAPGPEFWAHLGLPVP